MCDTKTCKRCGIEKVIDMFHINRRNSTGLCSYCKDCSKEAKKEWAQKNSEDFRQWKKEYRLKNKDRSNELRKEKSFNLRIRKIAGDGLVITAKTTKVCSSCKVEQTIDNFNKGGKNCWCRVCCKNKSLSRDSLPVGVTEEVADQIVEEYNELFENSLTKRLSLKYGLSPFQIRTVLKLRGVELKTHRVRPMTKETYVYLHKNLSGMVFYVGKGRGNRAWSKFRNNKEWMRFITDNEYVVEIFEDNLSDDAAILLEQQLFDKHKDTLVNRVSPIRQSENRLPDELNSHVYYDESSPTKLRWNKDVPLPNGGIKYMVGDVAGSFHKVSGRGVINLSGVNYYISRIVCELHGLSPRGLLVDHINGDCSDDRFSNLRTTTPTGNARNCVKPSRSNTGFVGVYDNLKAMVFTVSYRENGVSKTKRFNYSADNKEEILADAVKYRMDIISQMNGTPLAYSDRHTGVNVQRTKE